MTTGRPHLLFRLPAPSRREIHLFVDALRRVGARAVERDGDGFVALFPAVDDVEPLAAEIRSAVRSATSLADVAITWTHQSRDAWTARWRTEQAARRVSDRIIVAPVGVTLGSAQEEDATGSGLADAASRAREAAGPVRRDGDIVVRLDPGVAFGTAEHATTRACLTLLDERVHPGDRVLDVGAGSGILAVAAALLGATEVLALELDPVSCEAARRNAEVNDVADRVEVREHEVTPPDLGRVGRHDGVVINIEARVAAALVPAVPAALRPGGWLILSGVVGAERDHAVAAAERAGLALVDERPERSWWTGLFEPVAG